MKYLDDVKVTANREYYNKNNVFKGSIGTIIFAEITPLKLCFLNLMVLIMQK